MLALNVPTRPRVIRVHCAPGNSHLAIHHGGPRFVTAGEASSHELQGYLEGALRSSDDAVTRLILSRYVKKRNGA